jgi:hypothetical protein
MLWRVNLTRRGQLLNTSSKGIYYRQLQEGDCHPPCEYIFLFPPVEGFLNLNRETQPTRGAVKRNLCLSSPIIPACCHVLHTPGTIQIALSWAFSSSHRLQHVALPNWYEPPFFQMYSATFFQGIFTVEGSEPLVIFRTAALSRSICVKLGSQQRALLRSRAQARELARGDVVRQILLTSLLVHSGFLTLAVLGFVRVR